MDQQNIDNQTTNDQLPTITAQPQNILPNITTNKTKVFLIIIFALFILVIIVVAIGLLFSKTKPSDNLLISQLVSSKANVTQVENVLGKSTQEGETSLGYEYVYQTDNLTSQAIFNLEGQLIFVGSVGLTLDYKTQDEILSKFGTEVNYFTRKDIEATAIIMVYSSQGAAFTINPLNKTVLEQAYFESMAIENFIRKYGSNLISEPK